MKQTILAALVLMAASCSDPGAGPPGTGETSPVATEAKADTSPAPAKEETGTLSCPERSGYSYLPGDAVFTFAHQVRNDRMVQNRQGSVHRRVAIEILEENPAQVEEMVAESMERVGYRLLDTTPVPGGTRARFHKRGAGMAVVSHSGDPGGNPNNPGATGLLVVEFAQ